jgi:hypothetical protein
MTTINTPEDLLRLLRENEEFRATVRRELLTEELLALPQRFAEYAKANDARLDRMDARFDGIDVRLDRIDGRLDRVEANVDMLRGDTLERKTSTRLRQMLGRAFDVRRVQVIWLSSGVVAPLDRMNEFARKVEEGADAGIITEAEEDRLIQTDMVVRCLRKADGTRLWIAAEASGVIGERDISRARESAEALRKLYSQDAVPVVYGYRIADEQRWSAEARDGLQEVHVFLEPVHS